MTFFCTHRTRGRAPTRAPRGATSWSAAAETKKHDEDVARRRELPNQSLPVAGRTSEVELVETPCKETAYNATAAFSETAAAGKACVDDGRVVEDHARGVPNLWGAAWKSQFRAPHVD